MHHHGREKTKNSWVRGYERMQSGERVWVHAHPRYTLHKLSVRPCPDQLDFGF